MECSAAPGAQAEDLGRSEWCRLNKLAGSDETQSSFLRENEPPQKITKYAIVPSRIGCLAVKDAPSDCTLVYGVTIGSGRGFGVFRAIMALPPFNCDVLPMKGG